MNTLAVFHANLRARLFSFIFAGLLLGLAAVASAHHGNSDAPTPAPWSNGPAAPGLPGPVKPLGPGY